MGSSSTTSAGIFQRYAVFLVGVTGFFAQSAAAAAVAGSAAPAPVEGSGSDTGQKRAACRRPGSGSQLLSSSICVGADATSAGRPVLRRIPPVGLGCAAALCGVGRPVQPGQQPRSATQ